MNFSQVDFHSSSYHQIENNKKNRGLFRPTSYTHIQATPGDFYGCFSSTMKAFDPRSKIDTSPKKLEKVIKFIPSSPGKTGGYGFLNITLNPFPKYESSPYYTPYKPGQQGPMKVMAKWIPPSFPGFFKEHYTTDRVTYDAKIPVPWSLFGLFRPPNPTKSLGGSMAGCFESWPKHSNDPYIEPWKIDKAMEKKLNDKNKNPQPILEKKNVWTPSSGPKSYTTPSVLDKNVQLATNANTWRAMKPVTFTREFL